MSAPVRHTTIGPRTRPLLEEAGVPAEHLDGIEAGKYTWAIEQRPRVFASASLRVVNKQAREAAGKAPDHAITIYPTEASEQQWEEFGEDGVADYDAKGLGQQIIRACDAESRR